MFSGVNCTCGGYRNVGRDEGAVQNNCNNVRSGLVTSFRDWINPPWFISSEKCSCLVQHVKKWLDLLLSYSAVRYLGYFPSKCINFPYFWAIKYLCLSFSYKVAAPFSLSLRSWILQTRQSGSWHTDCEGWGSSCCLPEIPQKHQSLLTHSVLWDCLALSLVKYVNETLTRWKSHSCAVLPGQPCPWNMFFILYLKVWNAQAERPFRRVIHW